VAKTKMVEKEVVCPRCKGDGYWHSSCTGVRAKTVSGPVIDVSKPCPQCKGDGTINILIPEKQALAEAEAIKKEKAAAIARVTKMANTAIKQIKKDAAAEADKIKA